MESEARSFLESLFTGKQDELFVLLWTLPEKQSHWFQSMGRAIQFAESRCDHDLYVGVGLSGRDYGATHRCLSDEVAGIVGLWADLDLRSQAHPNKPLPRTAEEALALLPADLEPTITVATGNGLHVWWLFKEPWIFENDAERNRAAVLSLRFQTLLRYNAQERGWTFERLADLGRVLRVPGTVNAKDPNDRKAVTMLASTGHRYNPVDFEDYLDGLGIQDPESADLVARALAARFCDEPIVLNQDATIPEAMLAGWMESDARFRNTWSRQRHDLHDQSGSGYDLALACFGASHRLSAQQIVDLIVHHRRIHGEQRRTRMDYFQRTISKAMKSVQGSALSNCGTALERNVPAAAEVMPGCADSNGRVAAPEVPVSISKAILCDQISQTLGVRLLRLVKVPGQEPVYLMDLEEGRIEFDIAKLISQKSVGLAIAAKVGKIIPTFSPKPWRALVQMMLDACTVVENTDDLEFEGRARIQIAKYLAENPIIPSLVGAVSQDLYKPLIHEGRIAISSTDLVTYINRTSSQNLSVKSAAAMLAGIGSEAGRVRGRGFKEQSRWFLPLNEFDPADFSRTYEHEDVCDAK